MPCMSTVTTSAARLVIRPSIRLRLAEEVGDEGAARVLVELRRGAHLLDHAGVHHRDRVGHRHGLLLVVGDVDEGQPDVGLDPLELDLHRPAQLEVERAERLVEQQHLGLVDQRPGQRDPLLLAAGELRRLLAGLRARARPARASRSTCASTSVRLAPLEPERDVLEDVEVREQRVALEDGVDRAPVRLGVGDVLAGQRDRCPTSASRARRPSAASWSCRSRTGRAARRTTRAGTSRSRSSTAVNAPNDLVSVAQPQPVVRRRPAPGRRRVAAQPPVTSDHSPSYSICLLVVQRHEVERRRRASPRRGRSACCRPGTGRSSPSPRGRPRRGRCS